MFSNTFHKNTRNIASIMSSHSRAGLREGLDRKCLSVDLGRLRVRFMGASSSGSPTSMAQETMEQLMIDRKYLCTTATRGSSP